MGHLAKKHVWYNSYYTTNDTVRLSFTYFTCDSLGRITQSIEYDEYCNPGLWIPHHKRIFQNNANGTPESYDYYGYYRWDSTWLYFAKYELLYDGDGHLKGDQSSEWDGFNLNLVNQNIIDYDPFLNYNNIQYPGKDFSWFHGFDRINKKIDAMTILYENSGVIDTGSRHIYIYEDQTFSPDDYELDLSLYPNPAYHLLKLQINQVGEFSYKLFSIEGKDGIICQGTFQNKTSIDLGSVPSGVYIVEVSDGTGVIRKRLVIQ